MPAIRRRPGKDEDLVRDKSKDLSERRAAGTYRDHALMIFNTAR